VRDEGAGFDVTQLPDPTDAKNFLRPSGARTPADAVLYGRNPLQFDRQRSHDDQALPSGESVHLSSWRADPPAPAFRRGGIRPRDAVRAIQWHGFSTRNRTRLPTSVAHTDVTKSELADVPSAGAIGPVHGKNRIISRSVVVRVI
jgi:hypothetical protein